MSLFVDIHKKAGAFTLSMKFETDGGVLALLGASGAGKSMTLRCIAGIDTPDSGKIILNGRTLFDSEKRINIPPQQRHVGYLFQQYALFPDMTVEQNIRCGIKGRNSKDYSPVKPIMEKLGLAGFEKRKPSRLSGGQQQRVALARILVNEPELLLLDEPFSALDTGLRFRLEREVSGIIRDYGKECIFVSHDAKESYRMADNIVIIESGHITEYGSRDDVFSHPESRAGAVIVGAYNIFPAETKNENSVFCPSLGYTFSLSDAKDDTKYISVRPDDFTMTDGNGGIMCDIISVTEEPDSLVCMCRAHGGNGTSFDIRTKKTDKIKDGAAVCVWVNPENIHRLRE